MHRFRRTSGLLLAGALATIGCVAAPGSAPGFADQTAAGMPTPTASLAVGSETPVAPPLNQISADEAWLRLIPGDPAAVSYPSMASIVRDADAVVIATPRELTKGPDFTDDYGNVIYVMTLTLALERTIHGTVETKEPGTITVRTWLGIGDPGGDDFRAEFDRTAAALTRERAILFLANMAAYNERMGGSPDHPSADPFAYQILGGQGFIREVSGKAQPPKLPEAALSVMAGRWQVDARGLQFDAIVAQIEAIKP